MMIGQLCWENIDLIRGVSQTDIKSHSILILALLIGSFFIMLNYSRSSLSMKCKFHFISKGTSWT